MSEKFQRQAATIREEIVVYDYSQMGKTEMPGWLEEALSARWALEKKEQDEVQRLKNKIEEGVVEMERRVYAREEL
jgi:hypothetical protein